ncbi:MAG: putative zinc-binding protein [Candidatus Thorarchaeota archaeon]
MTFKPKVGLISCSGEACLGGNISRAATLEVLHHLRPAETITICLPLFLAGDKGEREFANYFPTITIDGCSKSCAAKSTAKFSSEPSVKLNLIDYLGEKCSNGGNLSTVEEHNGIVAKIAHDIALHVDRLREERR